MGQNPNLHTMECTSSAHGRESKPTAACSKSAIPSVVNGHQPHFQLKTGTMRKARFFFFISSTGYVFGNFFILLMQIFFKVMNKLIFRCEKSNLKYAWKSLGFEGLS